MKQRTDCLLFAGLSFQRHQQRSYGETGERASFCRVLVTYALLLIFLLLAGVGQAQTGGFMASSSDYLAYLHLSRNGSTLKGYETQVFVDNSSSAGFRTMRDNVTGTNSGGSIMLKVGGFLDQGTRELDGDYRNGKLYLSHPTANGAIVQLTFKPVTVQQWNSALFGFQRQIASRIAAAQRAAQIYQAQQAVARRREQATRDFTEAERTVRAAVPACLKWEKNVADAHEATTKAQEEFDTAKQQAEEAKTAFDDKQEELKQTEQSRTREENLTARDALKQQYEAVKALIATARDRFKALGVAKQSEETARYKYETDLSILTRCLTTAMGARSEMGRLGSPCPTLTGAIVRVSARQCNVYAQASDTSNVKGRLSKGTLTRIMTEDAPYISIFFGDKTIGWIRKADVEFL